MAEVTAAMAAPEAFTVCRGAVAVCQIWTRPPGDRKHASRSIVGPSRENVERPLTMNSLSRQNCIVDVISDLRIGGAGESSSRRYD